MRLRVPKLIRLAKRQPKNKSPRHPRNAYQLSTLSGGRISMSQAYRFARGEFRALSPEVVDALCDVFEIDDPGPLFERPKKKGAKPAGARRSARRD